MHYYADKIEKRLGEIVGTVYRKELPITSYKVKEGKEPGGEKIDLNDGAWAAFSTDKSWGGNGKYQWFRTVITIPQNFDGDRVAIRLDSSSPGHEISSAEYTVYVNGALNQGLDRFHHELLLAEEAKAGDSYLLAILGFNALGEKETFTKTRLVAIDRRAEEYYFNLLASYESSLVLEQNHPDYFAVTNIINDSVNMIDFRRPRSPEYYASLAKADDFLKENLYAKMSSRNDVVINAVGQTHIDVAWLWQLFHTREKCVRSFSTALKFMDIYPDYIFMQSQPQLYAYVKEDNPELYRKIKAKISEGRWQPEGGMWVEADCNLISGESMIRQFLVGKKFFKEEFGEDSKILWLPDVFGYNAAMPQILKKCGVDYFVTSKISWNQFNRIPADTFYLKGIDGTKVLTYFMTTPESRPWRMQNRPYKKVYNGPMRPADVAGTWNSYIQKDINNELMLAFGYGDGGGGPSKEYLEIARRLKDFPGMPKLKMQFPREYFENLTRRLRGKKIPEWAGELYLEYHRGTYTSMGRNKKYNRQSEFLYLNLEAFSVMAELFGASYPVEILDKNWKLILLNQFHDILPGSSTSAVYEDSRAQYEALLAEGKELLDSAFKTIMSRINAPSGGLAVFNPTSNCAEGVVVFKGSLNAAALAGPGGNVTPVQKNEDGTFVFYARNLPSKGYAVYKPSPGGAAVPELSVREDRLENRFFRITVDARGTLASIYDKRNNREVLAPGQRGNMLLSFEDKPINYNAWDIEAYYSEKMWEIDDVSSVEVIAEGPVWGGIRIVRNYLQSRISQDIIIYADVDRIDFKTKIDWRDQEILLKAAFPVDINATRASYEIQYGSVERNTHENTSWDVAKFEVCSHKWMDLSEGDYGVSLLNDCKYGADIHGNVLRLTLLRSPVAPFPDADKEVHEFTYSLYPHKGNWRESGTIEKAYALNNPCTARAIPAQSGTLPETWSFVSVDNPNIIVEAIKKAEDGDGYILRAYESGNTHSDTTLTFFQNLSSAAECSMLEAEEKSLPVEDNDLSVSFIPFEIKTVRIRF